MSSTVPNRIAFFSGSNFDPALRARGENCTDSHSEPDNLRCQVEGALPTPGYTYQGSAFDWPTLPELLDKADVSWRVYQNPNDNWNGNLHPGLAFTSFRTAKSGSSLYRNGMTHWSIDQFEADINNGELPEVSWIVPSPTWSEHPEASSPTHGAEFTARILNALTANTDVWSKTVFFLVFDEGDGFFDHVPPPALPSCNPDFTLAGGATLDLAGEYFSDPAQKYLLPEDGAAGDVRSWGLGPRVPMYVISPWSKGGWVNSQVFNHTSIAQFIEKRFAISVPNISPWHRAISGDLTSAFNFANPDLSALPSLPRMSGSEVTSAVQSRRPKPVPPAAPEKLFQEAGVRPSRALPYDLQVHATSDAAIGMFTLHFINSGSAGTVFHVYNRLHLDRIPRRYTVEAGKTFQDWWEVGDDDAGTYDLWVYGPNGFVREFKGTLSEGGHSAACQIQISYDPAKTVVVMRVDNESENTCNLQVDANAYRHDGPWIIKVLARRSTTISWNVAKTAHWYDFTVAGVGFERRFAGRVETGMDGISDPAM
jgi:phospholipase C